MLGWDHQISFLNRVPGVQITPGGAHLFKDLHSIQEVENPLLCLKLCPLPLQ